MSGKQLQGFLSKEGLQQEQWIECAVCLHPSRKLMYSKHTRDRQICTSVQFASNASLI